MKPELHTTTRAAPVNEEGSWEDMNRCNHTGLYTRSVLQTITTLDEATPTPLRPVLQPLPALTEAGTRLLEAASELFYDRGVRAVGVDLIAETAGTTKKTLYDRFGSKDALVTVRSDA